MMRGTMAGSAEMAYRAGLRVEACAWCAGWTWTDTVPGTRIFCARKSCEVREQYEQQGDSCIPGLRYLYHVHAHRPDATLRLPPRVRALVHA